MVMLLLNEALSQIASVGLCIGQLPLHVLCSTWYVPRYCKKESGYRCEQPCWQQRWNMAVRLVMLGSTHVLWWETGASHENAGLCAGAVREPAGEDSPGLLQVRLAVTAVNAGRAFSFLCVIFIAFI